MTINEDTRTITALHFGFDRPRIEVAHDGDEKILPYFENGQGAPVPWFEVYFAGKVVERVNAAHLASVEYET